MSKATASLPPSSSPPKFPAPVYRQGSASLRVVPEAVLDPAIFGALRDSLPLSAMGEIYCTLLADTEARLARLLQQDAASARSSLHAIHGSAGMLGASALAAHAWELEKQSAVPGPEALHDLEAACAQLRETLIAEGLAV